MHLAGLTQLQEYISCQDGSPFCMPALQLINDGFMIRIYQEIRQATPGDQPGAPRDITLDSRVLSDAFQFPLKF